MKKRTFYWNILHIPTSQYYTFNNRHNFTSRSQAVLVLIACINNYNDYLETCKDSDYSKFMTFLSQRRPVSFIEFAIVKTPRLDEEDSD